MLSVLQAATGLLITVSLVTLVLPIIGEAIATNPPAFLPKAENPLTALGLDYEDVTFPTTDGLSLRGWFIHAGRPDAPAILYAPATGHDQRSGLSLVRAFHAAGYHVLLFSYRGHGLSDGQKGRFTYGHVESKDVDAAVMFLHASKGVNRIAAIGHSAGAVSAILSGARNPQVGAVVAVAPFNSLAEVWRTNRPSWVPLPILEWTLWVAERLRGFKREEVRPLDVVVQISPRPLLLIHGTDDRRIPETQIRQMFAAADAPKTLWLVKGATHGGIRSPALDALTPEVISFLNAAWKKDGQLAAGSPRSRVVTEASDR